MAWNPSPEVAEAWQIGRKYGYDQVILIMLDRENRKISSASYGETKALCDNAKKLLDTAYDAVLLHIREEEKSR